MNRTGGRGVVGHSAIAQAAADGYTIGIITVEIGMLHWQGLTELNGASYTPLALVNVLHNRAAREASEVERVKSVVSETFGNRDPHRRRPEPARHGHLLSE